MADYWLNPTQLFDGHTLHNTMAARVENGVVKGIAPKADITAEAETLSLNGPLTPGDHRCPQRAGGCRERGA